jgi:hypothetical protein
MLRKKAPAAATQAEAAALPAVHVDTAEQTIGMAAALPPMADTYRLGAGVYVSNYSGDGRTPDEVYLMDGDGREHRLEGVIGYHVDHVRGVVTLEIQPERVDVEHVVVRPLA